jgi:chromosome partition protein MukE
MRGHYLAAFDRLEDVIRDDRFPTVDLMLRRGRHIGQEDGPLYEYILASQSFLEEFYERFKCGLVHRADGYFFLLPVGSEFGNRHLSEGAMLVGQMLALMYFDPMMAKQGGRVTSTIVLQSLSQFRKVQDLAAIFSPKVRKMDERRAGELVRDGFKTSVRELAMLGFIEELDDDSLRLRKALLRFAEQARGTEDPATRLEELVARGEVVMDQAGEADREDEEEA